VEEEKKECRAGWQLTVVAHCRHTTSGFHSPSASPCPCWGLQLPLLLKPLPLPLLLLQLLLLARSLARPEVVPLQRYTEGRSECPGRR